MINKKRLIRLTQELIQINSQNPPGNEREIALFVRSHLEKLGIQTKIYEFKKNRTNILCTLKSKGNKSLLLSPHLDTVPAGNNWKFPPLAGKLFKNRIYGRGASDCKGNLACALEAITSIVEEKKHLDYNLVFAATSDEETGSHLGLIPLLDKGILKPDAAIILDADEFEIIISQKGLIHFKINVFGKKAHGAYPDRGINAIEISAGIIQALKKHKFKYEKHPLLKAPTVNIGTITGGDKVNMVADFCSFGVDLRFLPGMRSEAIINEVKRITNSFANKYRIEIQSVQAPFNIDKNHFLVNNLMSSLRRNNRPVRIRGSEGATVITFFQHKNIPAVATGFSSKAKAHTTDEHIPVKNLVDGAKLLETLLLNFKFPSKNNAR